MFKQKNDTKTTKKQLTSIDRDRKDFTYAFNDCWDRLKLNHYYSFGNDDDCEILSRRASIVSKDMYTFMVKLFDNMSKHLDADVVNAYTDSEAGTYANSDTDTDLTVDGIIDVDSRQKITKNYSAVEHNYSKLNNKIKNEIKANQDDEDNTDNESSASSTISSVKKEQSFSIFDELPDCNKPTDVVDKKPKKKQIIVKNIYAKKYSHQVKKKSMKIKKPKKNSPAKESVTFKDKVKIVKLMFDNPSLKIEEIKELSGCDVLENFSQIYKWANQVDTQGSFKSIMGVINESVYQKYNDNINIINKNNIDGLLYKWGMEAKKSFFPNRDINFKAGKDWIKNFKFANKININTDPPKQLTRSVDMVLRVKRLREEDDDDDDDEVAVIKERKKTGNKKIKRRTLPSFEDKQKIVKLSNENPDWSIDTLIKMCGVDCVIDEEKIEKWKKELKKGGSLRDKHKLLNSWVLAKFDEHRKNMIPVNFEMIKDWGDEGRKELNIRKLASNESTWVNRFKNKNQVFGDDDDLQRKP